MYIRTHNKHESKAIFLEKCSKVKSGENSRTSNKKQRMSVPLTHKTRTSIFI
jgi:hypothetical protein